MSTPTSRRRVSIRVAAAAAGLAAITVLAGAAQSATPRNVAAPNPREPERIYRQVCGYCHGHNVAPLIRGRKLDPAAIEYFVRNGNGAMPAFKPTEITNQELAALAKWVSASKADPKEHGK